MDTIKNSFNTICEKAKNENLFIELLINSSEGLNLGYQKQKLETYKASESTSAGFRLVRDGQQAYSSTENVSEEGLNKAFSEALSNLNLMKDLKAPKKEIPLPTNQKALHEKLTSTQADVEILKEKASQLESQAKAQDSRISVVPYSGLSESKTKTRLLNSNGLDTSFEQQIFSAYSYPLAKEGEVSKMSGFGLASRNLADLDTNLISKEAAQRSLSLLPAKTLASGKYSVLIDKEVATDLFGLITNYFSAKAVDENKSILKNKLGTPIASDRLTIIDDPTQQKGFGYHPFDAEGELTRKTTLVEKGNLKNYLTNLEYAKKMNLPHTASAARSTTSDMQISCSNFIVEKGSHSLDELLKSSEKVIYLTELSGFHSGFNEATGDFSLPGQGFLYVNGELQHPVDQFVVSGNILTLLNDIVDLGNEYNPPGSSIMTPDLLVKELYFAGAKQ